MHWQRQSAVKYFVALTFDINIRDDFHEQRDNLPQYSLLYPVKLHKSQGVKLHKEAKDVRYNIHTLFILKMLRMLLSPALV